MFCVFVLALFALLLCVAKAWTPDPIKIDKTSYCKVCKRLSNYLQEQIINEYVVQEQPSRPKVSDLQRMVRQVCKKAKFKRRGLEACYHIVRGHANAIVHSSLDELFASDQSTALRRNPTLAAADNLDAHLERLICARLAFTSCPPKDLDKFILPDEELWQLSAKERELAQVRRAALRAASFGNFESMEDDAAALDDDVPTLPPLPPLKQRAAVRTEWARPHEYAHAIDEQVAFDEDDDTVDDPFYDDDDDAYDTAAHKLHEKPLEKTSRILHDEL